MGGPSTVRVRSAPLSSPQVVVLALLVVSITINYVDRGSLSVAQRYLTAEFHLDTIQLSDLFAAFFWTYASLQIFSGYLADKWPVKWVYGTGYLVWSVAMSLTGLTTGFASLLTLRLLLGLGESVAYPSYSRVLAASFREEQRGFANALIDAGSKVGPAIGVLAGGLFMEKAGWRVFFLLTGVVSCIWLVPWTRYAPTTKAHVRSPEGTPSLVRILQEPSAWGTFLGLLCSNYAWYFMVFWLPPYLENERHFSHHDMSVFGSAPFWGVAATAILAGWVSDRLIARGYSPNVVRKTAVSAGLLLCTLILPAMLVRSNVLALILLTLACSSFGLFSSNVWAITQTLAGPLAAGKWTGLQNAIGNLPGMFGLIFTGWIIQVTGHYFMAFVATAGFLLVGSLSFVVLVPRVEPIDWTRRRSVT